VLTIAPVWSTVNPPGTIIATTGFFTAGNTIGSFPNSVQACIPTTTICDQANVIVISPPAPPALGGGFTVLGRAAVTCTLGSITPGDVGTFQAAGDAPPGSITASCIPVTSPGTVHAPGDAATKTAYNNFLAAYTARAPLPGDCDATHTLTGTLAGVTLPPGVYCFSAGAALTGTLTLNGTATGLWLFKIGTTGTGDLTGTNFTVIMAGAALPCNVTWWVRQAASMTTSSLKGTVIAGTGVTVTGGTFGGNMWAGASGTGDATETGATVTGCP
jgi:Ice-binding-like